MRGWCIFPKTGEQTIELDPLNSPRFFQLTEIIEGQKRRRHSGANRKPIHSRYDIEVKGTRRVHANQLRAMRALLEEHTVKAAIVVSRDSQPRMLANVIAAWPWRLFLAKRWTGEVI